jgi:hypothetical protein
MPSFSRMASISCVCCTASTAPSPTAPRLVPHLPLTLSDHGLGSSLAPSLSSIRLLLTTKVPSSPSEELACIQISLDMLRRQGVQCVTRWTCRDTQADGENCKDHGGGHPRWQPRQNRCPRLVAECVFWVLKINRIVVHFEIMNNHLGRAPDGRSPQDVLLEWVSSQVCLSFPEDSHVTKRDINPKDSR